MKSPVGKRLPLVAETLPEGLKCYRCRESGGRYILANAYWQWRTRHGEPSPHLPSASSESEPKAVEPARLCPETGTIMTRYEVGHGFPFSIDRSITGGVWLDEGEWEALRARNFHDELHLVFTAPWQRQIVEERSRASYEALLRERLGGGASGQADRSQGPTGRVAAPGSCPRVFSVIGIVIQPGAGREETSQRARS